tara:strand:+ start:5538 stop:6779 length:1242 start_codon:yes stop_codon:yes gene_type:complete
MESSHSWIANVEILNAQLAKETWYNTFWSKFSGNVDISKDDNGNNVYSPSGNPIEILKDFVQQGRDNMLIPFLRELTGSPVFGDTVLKGTGEDQTLYWLRQFVNQYRKAVMKKSGSMSEQRQKIFKLYEAAKPQLSRWFTKYENQLVFQTFYEGASQNLTAGTNDDGLGLGVRYNPNWWVNDGGVLTSVGTKSTFPTVANLDAGVTAADQKMTSDILWQLRTKCMELMIPQMTTKDGHKYYCMIVHPSSMRNLYAESSGAFKTAQREAFSSKMLALPELSGATAYYAGFVFYEDIVGIRGWDGANLGFDSVSEMFDPTDVTTNVNSIVFGKNAIGKGVAKDLHFTSEIDDHTNIIEVGGAMINGYGRADFVAEGDGTEGAGDAFETGNTSKTIIDSALTAINQSSLILMTDEA